MLPFAQTCAWETYILSYSSLAYVLSRVLLSVAVVMARYEHELQSLAQLCKCENKCITVMYARVHNMT